MPTNLFNPFPGLRPFQMEEEYLFFGRETQRKELIALLREHRFVAVLGASGSGKSSLVRAGLLPALFGGVMTKAGSHWNIAILRPGGGPIANLAEALLSTEMWGGSTPPAPLELETTLARSGLGLVEAVRQARLPATENLLVVVDQFEELFRFSQSQSERSTRDEAAAFVNLLMEAARQEELSIYVVLTMRSDFFGDCSQFEELAEAINKGEYLVPRLTRDQKKQAIEGPARVGGGRIAPRLLQRLLNDVGDDPDQLPIMQHALMRTWDHWAADHAGDEPLDLRHYESIGAMREALSRHADEVQADLPDEQHKRVAERLFKALTERGADNRGIRRPTRMRDLCEITGASDKEMATVVEAFRKSGRTFLMPPESVELKGDTVIDISHESLMRVWQRLRGWVEEEAQSARIYRRLAETAALYEEKKAGLYYDPDLQIALSWRDTGEPNEAWAGRYYEGFEMAMAFLKKSAAAKRAAEEEREAARQRELEQARALAEAERARATEQQRSAFRMKKLARGLALVVVIALGSLVVAMFARREAQNQARLANTAKQLAQISAGQLRETLTRSEFVTASEQLESHKADKSLAYLARSLRTDPSYWPAAFQIVTLLSERNFLIDPPKIIAMDKPIENWGMNQTKDSIFTEDIDSYGALWDAHTGQKIGPFGDGKRVDSDIMTEDGALVFVNYPDEGGIQGFEMRSGKAVTPVFNQEAGADRFLVNPSTKHGRLVLARDKRDGSIRLWEALQGKPLTPPLKTSARVRRFGFSPDGELFYGDFDDRKVGVWRTGSGEAVLRPVGHGLVVNVAAFSPDSTKLVLNSEGSRLVQWWDLRHADALPQRVQLDLPVRDIVFEKQGRLMALLAWSNPTASNPRPGATFWIAVYDLETGERRANVAGENLEFWEWGKGGDSAVLINDPWLIATAVNSGDQCKLWDLYSGKLMAELHFPDSPIESVTFLRDGSRVRTRQANYSYRIWDLFTGRPLTDAMPHRALATTLGFSPDQTRLFTYNRFDMAIRTWDILTGKELLEPSALTEFFADRGPAWGKDRLEGAFFHSATTRLADRLERQSHGAIAVWKFPPAAALEEPLTVEGPIDYAEFSPDGARIVAGYRGASAEAIIWDVGSSKVLKKFRHPGSIYNARFAPDGKKIVTASFDRVARIWDVSSGEILLKLNHDWVVQTAQFDPNGKTVLTTTEDGRVRLWDVESGLPLTPSVQHGAHVDGASFSRDGTRFVTGSIDGRMRIVEAATGTGLIIQDPDRRSINAAISPDGQQVASVGFPGKLKVWNALTGEMIGQMPQEYPFQVVAFHPKRKLIAAGGAGHYEIDHHGLVYLWDWEKGRIITEPLVIEGQPDRDTLKFSPDGKLLAVGTSQGTLSLWEVATGRNLLRRRDHAGLVLCVNFSPDGRRLLTASRDRTIRMLDLPPTEPPVPAWVPDLAEAVSGKKINDAGGVENVSQNKLLELKRHLASGGENDYFSKWARWFFESPTARKISPRANLTVSEYALRLANSEQLTNLFRAVQLDPNNGVLYARVGHQWAISSLRTNLASHATNLWNSTAQWYSDQATNLAPQSAEVWALRGSVFEAIGKPAEGEAAIEQALKLEKENLIGSYVRAFQLLRQGDKEGAYRAYTNALELLLQQRAHLAGSENRPYLIGTFKRLMELPEFNPLTMARAGRARLDDLSDETDRKFWEANWLTRRASELAPNDASIWRLRSEVLFDPVDEPEALAAFKKAVDLDASGNIRWKDYGYFLRSRVELLEQFKRFDIARQSFLSRAIPPRPAEATPSHIDLTSYYNAGLLEDTARLKGSNHAPSRCFQEMPLSMRKFDGVEFDVRGQVFIPGTEHAGKNLAVGHPESIKNIRIARRVGWLHFLQACSSAMPAGTKIGQYVLHYSDGESQDLPIVVGTDVVDYMMHRFDVPAQGTLAWTDGADGAQKRIFHSIWENPRPKEEIRSIDFISDVTTCSLMLFGITCEDAKEEAELKQLSPGLLAGEAYQKVTQVRGLGQAGKDYAEKLIRIAQQQAPNDTEVRKFYPAILLCVGKNEEARQIIDDMLQQNPADAFAWGLRAEILEKAEKTKEALAAYEKAAALLSGQKTFDSPARQDYLRRAAALIENTDGAKAAHSFFVRASVPPRETKTPAHAVDLAAYYNAALNDGWRILSDGGNYSRDLVTMPRGSAIFEGIAFDLRGIIQLDCGPSRSLLHSYPRDVKGIPVSQKAGWLHFIHGTSHSEREGTIIARYVVQYANGERREFQVRFGQDLWNFWIEPDVEYQADLVWKNDKASLQSGQIGVFMSTWENPLPDIEIKTIDYLSAVTECAPFLLALTAEPIKTDAEIDNTPPLELAELAFHKVNPKHHPSTKTVEYARRLSEKAASRAPKDGKAWALRAEMLHRVGDETQALKSTDEAIALQSETSDLWKLRGDILTQLKQFQAASQARSKSRSARLKEIVASRSQSARPELIDLSAFYNAGTEEPLHGSHGTPSVNWETLAALPKGIQTLGGIEFDLRGVVHTSGKQMAMRSMLLDFPKEIKGIKVGHKAKRLHILHSAGWALDLPHGQVISKYVIHYTDGRQQETPATVGQDIRDWFLSETFKHSVSDGKLAWQGRSQIEGNREIGLYLKTWTNPWLDAEISHLDFVSEMTDAAPFLVALTLEP